MSTPLGDFVRAKRDSIQPESFGLPAHGRRRSPGLRRSDLATRAGISVEYLTRIEQGRDRNPSPAVINALADALSLDAAERDHLRYRTLAQCSTPQGGGEGHSGVSGPEGRSGTVTVALSDNIVGGPTAGRAGSEACGDLVRPPSRVAGVGEAGTRGSTAERCRPESSAFTQARTSTRQNHRRSLRRGPAAGAAQSACPPPAPATGPASAQPPHRAGVAMAARTA